MSPIEKIKSGIVSCSWADVCDGYADLTGERLPQPTDTEAENALRQILAIASGAVDSVPDQEPVLVSKMVGDNDKTNKKQTKKTRTKKKATKKRSTKKPTIDKDGNDTSIDLDDTKKTVVSKTTDGVRLITNDPDPEEVERNKAKAEKARRNKLQLGRKSTKTYSVKCNECGKKFDSSRPDGELGQKCSGCLNSKKGRMG